MIFRALWRATPMEQFPQIDQLANLQAIFKSADRLCVADSC